MTQNCGVNMLGNPPPSEIRGSKVHNPLVMRHCPLLLCWFTSIVELMKMRVCTVFTSYLNPMHTLCIQFVKYMFGKISHIVICSYNQRIIIETENEIKFIRTDNYIKCLRYVISIIHVLFMSLFQFSCTPCGDACPRMGYHLDFHPEDDNPYLYYLPYE